MIILVLGALDSAASQRQKKLSAKPSCVVLFVTRRRLPFIARCYSLRGVTVHRRMGGGECVVSCFSVSCDDLNTNEKEERKKITARGCLILPIVGCI